MAYNYSYQKEQKDTARAVGIALPISTKKSIEVVNFIRGKKLPAAIAQLEKVTEKKLAVPYKRFARGGTGHKKGMGPGRYPINTCKQIIMLLKNAEANAQQKGLNVKDLMIEHISAQMTPKSWHYGRKRRRQMKRTHIEVVVKEKRTEEKQKVAK